MSDLRLPANLRELRTAVGLSCRQLDIKAGLSTGHTALIESGVRASVTAETLGKIAAALEVTMDELWVGERAPELPESA